MTKLDDSIQYLKGVGPKKAIRLKRLGISKIKDALLYLPRGYEDRTKTSLLAEASNGEKQSFILEVTEKPAVSRPRRGLSILKVPVKDDSGSAVMVWFNQNYLKDKFQPGKKYQVYGKISANKFQIQILNPDVTLWNIDEKASIAPIYPLTDGISNKELTSIIKQALQDHTGTIRSAVPTEIIDKRQLPEKSFSLSKLHFPDFINQGEQSRKALAYEELLILQLGLLRIKNQTAGCNNGILFKENYAYEEFINNLPFKLTSAQSKVLEEITSDMMSSKKMNRLVQGDVGSGKTIVGIAAMYLAVLNGYQAVMMAPTEILANQHYDTINEMVNKLAIRVEFLSGNTTGKSREKLLSDLREGSIDILVGTHAVIQEKVEFNKLGLAITDEQHRFGVKQRMILSEKGESPDLLVMTATPIPRTLALILYGDLDISIIDELPPGRRSIETYSVGVDMETRIFNFVRKQIHDGRQAYIVCPLIEEQERLELTSAEALYKRLTSEVFQDLRVSLLHGKMAQKDKDAVMSSFKDGFIDILVSTTVIEVGVNVPNANIMVVVNSERFGLAQLHQLRGRIGRGEYQSYCVLINSSNSNIARERMRILQSTSDGFLISEKDLELRGPGEFFGTRQHGIPELRIANLVKDIDVLKKAQEDAIEILSKDPELMDPKYKLLNYEISRLFDTTEEEIILN